MEVPDHVKEILCEFPHHAGVRIPSNGQLYDFIRLLLDSLPRSSFEYYIETTNSNASRVYVGFEEASSIDLVRHRIILIKLTYHDIEVYS